MLVEQLKLQGEFAAAGTITSSRSAGSAVALRVCPTVEPLL